VRKIAKSALLKCWRALPIEVRWVIWEELLRERGTFKAAGDLARKAGISGFIAEGDCGVIRGALDDQAALARYAESGTWARYQTALFEHVFAERDGTYIDIGANIGLTVIPIARNSRVNCYAFEPEPTNFRHLSENVLVNCRARNVRLFNVALYDREASVPFEIAACHSGDHRISLAQDEGELDEHSRNRISVQAKRLDDLITEASDPIAVKIDVQGAEPFVIAGGRGIMSRASLLALEFWPYSMRRMRGDLGAELAFLCEHFRDGSINQGDSDLAPTWQPIHSVAERLDQLFTRKTTAHEYWDVMVRKG
jgi:FkbM family methyltransferase